eukprot:2223698-Prymnesium_polylepis.1
MVRRTSESNTAARDALTQVVRRPLQVRNPAAGARRRVCFVSSRTIAWRVVQHCLHDLEASALLAHDGRVLRVAAACPPPH